MVIFGSSFFIYSVLWSKIWFSSFLFIWSSGFGLTVQFVLYYSFNIFSCTCKKMDLNFIELLPWCSLCHVRVTYCLLNERLYSKHFWFLRLISNIATFLFKNLTILGNAIYFKTRSYRDDKCSFFLFLLKGLEHFATYIIMDKNLDFSHTSNAHWLQNNGMLHILRFFLTKIRIIPI